MKRRAGGQGGYVAAELALGIGLLVFPVAALVMTLPGWSERQAAARQVAREVARFTAVSGSCDVAAAQRHAQAGVRGLGLDPSDIEVALDCDAGASLARGGGLTARVGIHMPAVAIPGIMALGAWHWTAAHTEVVDPYRSFG